MTYRTNAIDSRPSAKKQDGSHHDLKMMFSSRCEHDTSITFPLTDSNFEIFSYVIKNTNGINIGLIS